MSTNRVDRPATSSVPSRRRNSPPHTEFTSPYVVPHLGTSTYDIRRKRIGVSFHERHPREKKHVLTRLFSEQVHLQGALLRQSRLLKVDVTEVRSAEADRLQEVNQDILDASLSGTGIKNTLPRTKLTHAQWVARSIWSYAAMGNWTMGEPRDPNSKSPPNPGRKPPRARKRSENVRPFRPRSHPSLEECFTLRGPLARDFARAVERGYSGPPSRWLRGPRAACLIEKLRIRGFAPESLVPRVTSPWTPLFYVVNDHSGIGPHSLTHGFRGERIRRQPTDYVTLSRQARLTKRLSVKELSERCGDSCCWPTYPTLNESWAILCRIMDPQRRYLSCSTGLPRPTIRLSARQVTPASAAHAISNYLIGFRGDISAPKYVLRHCGYRWGFLILRRYHFLPANVVRWLTRLWKADFTSLWLRKPLRFRDALRTVPDIRFYRMSGFELASSYQPRLNRKRRARRSRNRRKLDSKQGLLSPTPSDNSGGGVRLY